MIYYDVTKTDGARQKSGIIRVSSRLRDEFEGAARSVRWDEKSRDWLDVGTNSRVALRQEDWLFTVELFSEAERPGFRAFVAAHPCRLAAVFHDAIPLQLPRITWPQSVQRHPDYMKMLAGFDRVFSVSKEVAADLAGFWQWQGATVRASVSTVKLGADFDQTEREIHCSTFKPGVSPLLLCVGIVEPRKNQSFLIDVAELLWREKMDFELHVVGRINPHFGKPMAARMKALQKLEKRFHFHTGLSDGDLSRLYSQATALAFPTIAEGCGLPLLEALWRGVPCVCSDLPVLAENAAGGGCVMATTNDLDDWRTKLSKVLADVEEHSRLQKEATARMLPRWKETAKALLTALR